MNCLSCNKELNFPEGVLKQLSNCPFCGGPLKLAQQKNDADDLLKSLISKYGRDICSDERSEELGRLLARVPDAQIKQRNVLILFQQYNLLSNIYEAVSLSANERKTQIKDSVEFLFRCFRIPIESGLKMTLWIASCLGINISSINEKSLGIMPLSKAVERSIDEVGFGKFGFKESVEEILENCEKGVDLRNFIILIHMGILKKLKMSLGKSASAKTKAFMESVELLKDIFIPEATAIRMVNSLAKGMNFSIENAKFVDCRDGEVYKVVTINNQTWMAENFRHICNGAVTHKEGSQCDVLYTWEGARNACPRGWRLPSREEAEALKMFAIKGFVENFDTVENCLYANKMDVFGFSANPAGCASKKDGVWVFEDDGDFEYWTNDKNENDERIAFSFSSIMSSIPRLINETALAVRYVKNKED